MLSFVFYFVFKVNEHFNNLLKKSKKLKKWRKSKNVCFQIIFQSELTMIHKRSMNSMFNKSGLLP